MAERLMSQTDYAKHRGISQPRVHRMIKTGLIPADCLEKEGKYTRIVVEAADQALSENLDPSKKSKTQKGGKPKRITYEEQRTRNEFLKAERAKLQLERERGELVPKADVERQAFDCGRRVRDAVLCIPDTISAILAAEKDEAKVRDRLTRELSAALEGAFK